MKKVITIIIVVLILGLAMAGFAIEESPVRDRRAELLKALEETTVLFDEDGDIYSYYITTANCGDPDDKGFMDCWFNVDLNLGHVVCYGTAVEVWTNAETGEEIMRAESHVNEQYDIRYDFVRHDWEVFNYGPYVEE